MESPRDLPEEGNEGGDCKVSAGWLGAQRSIRGEHTGKYLLRGGQAQRATGKGKCRGEARRQDPGETGQEAGPGRDPQVTS